MTDRYGAPEHQHEQYRENPQEPSQPIETQPPTQQNAGPAQQSPQQQPTQSMPQQPIPRQLTSQQSMPQQSTLQQPTSQQMSHPTPQSQHPETQQVPQRQFPQQSSQQRFAQQPSQRELASASPSTQQATSQQPMSQQPNQQAMSQQPNQQAIPQPQQATPQQPSRQSQPSHGQYTHETAETAGTGSATPQAPEHQRQPQSQQPIETVGGTAQQAGGTAQHTPGSPQSATPTSGTQLLQRSEVAQTGSATVDRILQRDVVTVREDTPIATAVSEMKSADVGSVVVVDESRTPVGLLTDREIALALGEMPDIAERAVSELAYGGTVTGSSDMSVFDAVQRLNTNSIRRLPIVSEDGSLEGIVTLDDIMVLLAAEFNSVAEIIKSQSPRL